jgi:hypothetical protein
MIDCDRLLADAEEARIFSEVARSKLLMAQAALRHRTARRDDARERQLKKHREGDRPASRPKASHGS